MAGSNPILERLSQSGVFFWDASQSREFEVSESFREFLGLSSCKFGITELRQFLSEEAVESSFRKSGLGENEWHTFWTVGGKDYGMRIVRVKQYYDAKGFRHSIGTATLDNDDSSKSIITPRSLDAPISIFDGNAAGYYQRQMGNGRAATYDLIADMNKAFRSHFPPDVMVSIWEKIGDEFVCVSVAGQIATAQRHDVFHAGFRCKSKVMDLVCKNYGVQMFESLEDYRGVSDREVQGLLDSGWHNGAICTIRSIDSGGAWGFVSCGSIRQRTWRNEEKQRIQLLSDSLSVLMAQTSAYQQVFHNLVISQLACEAGGFSTWQWDVVAHKRTLLLTDGSMLEVPYDLNVHHDDRDAYLAAFADVVEGNKATFSLRLRMRQTASNKTKWFDVMCKAVTYGADGHAESIVGIARDIDEQVRAEEIKQKEVDRRNEIYDKLPAIIAFCDVNGVQKYINQRAVETLGVRSLEDRYGINFFDCPLLTDDQRNLIRTRDSCSIDLIYDFKKIRESGYYRTSRNDSIELTIRSAKLYSGGVMTGYLFVYVDRSLQAAQERRISLLDGFFAEIGRVSKIGVCQFGQGGFVSSQWNHNLAMGDSLVPFRSLASEAADAADLDRVNKAVAELYVNKSGLCTNQVRVRQSDGQHVVNIHCSFSSIVNEVVAISVDVTEQEEREEAIVRALRKSEQVESLRSQFFNNVSHELRTPLNAIVGFSDLIAQTQTEGELARYAAIIRRNNEQLLNLVDGIMELSQLQTGNLRFVRRMIEVDAIVSESFDRMDGRQNQGVQFIATHDPKLRNFRVSLDAVTTTQIVSKLISNAFNATTSGCVMLWATVESDYVYFHVSDTGSGIPDDKLKAIFDVFVKVDEFAVGAGLGLPICREMARQLGGDIGYETTLGKGSHFWLKLPILVAGAPDSSDGGSSHNVVVMPHWQGLSLSVSLLMSRCNVFSCTRSELSKVWMDNRPELAILDVRECPDVILRFIENIRSFGDKYKIIVVNTADSGVLESDILKAGAQAVVEAPLSEHALSRAILHVMGDDFTLTPSEDVSRIIA